MKAYLQTTPNLGDFLNGMPVMSGLVKSLNEPMDLLIRHEMRKFVGIKEFLMYQGIFNSVNFDDEVVLYNNPRLIILSSWYREDKNNPNRPTETCRYENFVKDHYKIDFEVDDGFILQCPDIEYEFKDTLYVGDRWSVGDIDARRECHILESYKKYGFEFIDYSKTLLENCYIVKNCPGPFISNFTGVGIMADLLNIDNWIVWKAEDWKPEFRAGEDDISWDNGKNIEQIFEKHMYLDRKSKLVHYNFATKYFEEHYK